MDIVRGSLEEISRAPSSGRTRPGSRAGSAVAGEWSRPNGSPAGGALEILSPEPPALKEHTISLEDISDISTDSDTCLNEDTVDPKFPSDPSTIADKMFKISLRFLETRVGTSSASEEVQEEPIPIAFVPKNTSQETQEDHAVDNRVQKALEKMKKLDKILLRKEEREKEVKREGRVLLQTLWKDLQTGERRSAEEEENTRKYLALIPPTSFAWGDDRLDEAPVTPLFHTQVPFEEINNETPTGHCGSRLTKSSSSTTQRNNADGTSIRGINKECISKTTLQESECNFIRKNIEMVREVGNPIQITEDEKNRILQLLDDIDDLEEDSHPDSEDKQAGECVAVMAGEGYVPDLNEQHQLEEIDSRLQSILPAEQFALIRSTPHLDCGPFQQEPVLNGDAVGDGPGEKALQDFRETRELQQRLQEIELQLERLQKAAAEPELSSLSELDLRLLLSKCPGWEETSSCESTPRGNASLSLTKALLTKLHEGRGNISDARHHSEEAAEMNANGDSLDEDYYLRKALSKSGHLENVMTHLSEQSEDGVETNDLESSDRESCNTEWALKLKEGKEPLSPGNSNCGHDSISMQFEVRDESTNVQQAEGEL